MKNNNYKCGACSSVKGTRYTKVTGVPKESKTDFWQLFSIIVVVLIATLSWGLSISARVAVNETNDKNINHSLDRLHYKFDSLQDYIHSK